VVLEVERGPSKSVIADGTAEDAVDQVVQVDMNAGFLVVPLLVPSPQPSPAMQEREVGRRNPRPPNGGEGGDPAAAGRVRDDTVVPVANPKARRK